MNTLEDIIHYVSIGIFPNSAGIMSMTVACDAVVRGHWASAMLNAGAAVANFLVGYSKFTEYQKVKDALQRYGWQERIVKPKMYSWCQRHAARQAAVELGYEEKFDTFAEKEGHKWYHLLPKPHRFHEM